MYVSMSYYGLSFTVCFLFCTSVFLLFRKTSKIMLLIKLVSKLKNLGLSVKHFGFSSSPCLFFLYTIYRHKYSAFLTWLCQRYFNQHINSEMMRCKRVRRKFNPLKKAIKMTSAFWKWSFKILTETVLPACPQQMEWK